MKTFLIPSSRIRASRFDRAVGVELELAAAGLVGVVMAWEEWEVTGGKRALGQ
jgi:hypothetical protein